MEQARAFVVIGYGFSDEHIQPKLREAIQKTEIPILVLTKELTPAGHDLLRGGTATNYTILESDGSGGTTVHLGEPKSTKVLPNTRLWNLRDFLKMAISA